MRLGGPVPDSSIKVTEKDYSPWVCVRQEQLEADVRRTWETVIPESEPDSAFPAPAEQFFAHNT